MTTINARREARRAGKEALRFQGIERFCVLWMQEGRERKSPWFASRERAHLARKIISSKYGAASVFVD